MNKQDNARLREHIRNLIQALETIVDEQAADIAVTKPAESADDASPLHVTARITEHEKRELARLRANLDWLDTNNGGYCDSCEREIPIARLHAVPGTRLCIDCAE